MALIRPIPSGNGTVTEITASNVINLNSYSFDLAGVKVGSILAIEFANNSNTTANFLTDVPSVNGATVIDSALIGYLNSSCILIVKATSSTVSVSGTKPNQYQFTVKAYEIS